MDFWANLWSFLTAFGTIAMAVTTVVIICQGNRQHRDRFKPACVLMPYNGVDPLNNRGQLIEKIDPSPDNPYFGTLAIKCVLRNVGTGPALNLRIKFRFLDMNGWTTEPWELSPLGAGESRGGENSPLLVPIRIGQQPTGFCMVPSDFYEVTGKVWEIWLEYEDIFEQRFCAVHHKRPVQENSRPISKSKDGQYYAQPQPWVTFTKSRLVHNS
jgi:hypothetical protein